MPTIRDVARACGVAPMTVSHVLNKPEKVAPQTRVRVLRAIREMGYRPASTGAVQNAAHVLGVFNCLDFERSGYYQALLNAILRHIGRTDHSVLLFGGDAWRGDPNRSIRVHYDGHCDGVLYLAPSRADPLVAALRDRGIPFVLIGDRGDASEDGWVDVNNAAAAQMAMVHLLGLGHRRISFLGRDQARQCTVEREEGYLAAMRDAGLPPDSRAINAMGMPEEGCRAWLAAWYALPAAERPTAVFCWNDLLAETLLQELGHAGLRVPHDVSIIGFDGLPTSAASAPLTTLRQPYDALGASAVDLLLEQIRGEAPRRLLLPAELVERGSTGLATVSRPRSPM